MGPSFKDLLLAIYYALIALQISPVARAISNKNVELMHKFMCELGLSPVFRSRVSTTRSLGPKPWEFD